QPAVWLQFGCDADLDRLAQVQLALLTQSVGGGKPVLQRPLVNFIFIRTQDVIIGGNFIEFLIDLGIFLGVICFCGRALLDRSRAARGGCHGSHVWCRRNYRLWAWCRRRFWLNRCSLRDDFWRERIRGTLWLSADRLQREVPFWIMKFSQIEDLNILANGGL